MDRGCGVLRGALLVSGAGVAVLAAGPAWAQQKIFNVPAQAATTGIPAFARQAGVQILVAESAVRGRRTQAVTGAQSLQSGLAQLLAGTDLVVGSNDGRTVTLQPRPQDVAAAASAEPDVVDEVLVTGSRIRGAPPASPVITLSAVEMRNSGLSNLGEVVRSLPQSFSGGQNPGVVSGSPRPEDANGNSASSLNLRGLGPDATLTLLNGHRLAYDAGNQAVDISAIPMAAVDRIEILTDGASALYGSDAVAGVANVILKRNFSGLDVLARYGGSTDGGYTQHQLSAVGGRTWASGSILAAIDYGRSNAITADQRSYTQALNGSYTLIPEQEYHAVVAELHQRLAEGVEIAVDAVQSRRTHSQHLPLTAASSYLVNGTLSNSVLESYAITPRLSITAPGEWTASALATTAKDKSRFDQVGYTNGAQQFRVPGFVTNKLSLVELNGEGPIARLPGGDLRLAVGGGYRKNSLENYLGSVTATATTVTRQISGSTDSYFAFAEAFAPLVSSANARAGLQRLSVSAAVRYEDYPGLEKVTTPKIGIIYGPSDDFDLKLTWGRSFKAATLIQQYVGSPGPLLYPTTFFGPSTFPPGATVLFVDGGNPDLQPERANSWTASIAAHPTALPGARFELSVFRTEYRDRIVLPIASRTGLLTNPIYQYVIGYSPTLQQVNDLVASLPPLRNRTTSTFNPSSVVAIIDNRYRNVSKWIAQGVDVSAEYRIQFETMGALTSSANVAYLRSKQKANPSLPETDLAGVIFNPPHWRARLGATWDIGPATLSSYLNYIGGVANTRFAPAKRVDSMTTLDATARYAFEAASGPLKDTEVSVAILNLANAKPNSINATAPSPDYDSTNYSAIGRFVSITVGRRW